MVMSIAEIDTAIQVGEITLKSAFVLKYNDKQYVLPATSTASVWTEKRQAGQICWSLQIV